MDIQRATISDAQDVLAFLREFRAEGLITVLQHAALPTLEEEETFIRKLDGCAGIMLIARVDDKVVGCLTAEVQAHPQRRHCCEFGIGVLREHRRAGFGSSLISHLTNWARSLGLRRIELSVFGNNTEAIRLYRRLGYEIEATKRKALKVGDDYEDLIQMARMI